jgi:8-oxo-dGTP pyrophosphatase MutT (NUDIX family)
MSEFPRKRGSWTELQTEVKYSNAWIEVAESKVLNPNGGEGIYGVVHFKNLAIGVIPIDDEGYTWLVGQERFPFEGKFTWEIIEGGGPIEVDPIHSAQRELLEEAGLKAKEWELIQEMDLSNSATTEVAKIYVAKGLSIHDSDPDDTEKLEVKRIPFDEAYNMVLNGEIVDSLSVAGILRYKLNQLNKL